MRVKLTSTTRVSPPPTFGANELAACGQTWQSRPSKVVESERRLGSVVTGPKKSTQWTKFFLSEGTAMKMGAPPAGGAKKDGRKEDLLAGALLVIACVCMYVCVCTDSHLPSMDKWLLISS